MGPPRKGRAPGGRPRAAQILTGEWHDNQPRTARQLTPLELAAILTVRDKARTIESAPGRPGPAKDEPEPFFDDTEDAVRDLTDPGWDRR